MDFVAIPTEQTTALTDAILALGAFGAALYLNRFRPHQRWRVAVWQGVFIFLAGAATLGALAHGLILPPAVSRLFWGGISLAFGVLVALFLVAVALDLFGEAASRRCSKPLIGVGVGFFAATLARPDSFLIFILYEATAMLIALAGYLWLAARSLLPGAWWMTGGIAVSLLAAAIQASHAVTVTLVWTFDHNGVYHLLQMVGIGLMLAGLRRGLMRRN